MKLCVDCKWCSVSEAGFGYPKCLCPKNIEVITIKGNPLVPTKGKQFTSRTESCCEIHRSHDWLSSLMFRTCGKRGRWFEPKGTE